MNLKETENLTMEEAGRAEGWMLHSLTSSENTELQRVRWRAAWEGHGQQAKADLSPAVALTTVAPSGVWDTVTRDVYLPRE